MGRDEYARFDYYREQYPSVIAMAAKAGSATLAESTRFTHLRIIIDRFSSFDICFAGVSF